jgi:hypothetical protein
LISEAYAGWRGRWFNSESRPKNPVMRALEVLMPAAGDRSLAKKISAPLRTAGKLRAIRRATTMP